MKKSIKRLISVVLLAFVLIASIAMIGCSEEQSSTSNTPATPKSKLTLSATSLNLYVLDSETLTLETSEDGEISWTSTSDSLIELIPNGKSATINALRRGEVTVIATQGKNSVSCTINVFPTYHAFDVILESADNAQLKVGETYTFNTTVTVDDVEFTLSTFEYSVIQSSPAGSVSVADNGLITAVKQGTATVGVRAVYGDTYTEWKLVTVYVFPTDYSNDDQEQPSLDDGGYIEDVFDTEEIIPEPPEGGFIEDVFGE
ncbi:MAG: hypothetical protein IJV95_01675 [Clostridia bacterium]|nr:hypothetical protein [Clostridia bacterium]